MHPINWLRDQMMIPILVFFHSLTGSYGWSIILLTITIKLALMPLTIQQFRSMQAMAKLQPKIKELQEKYKDKPEILNQKVLEFYKDNKFNPLGGCLPLFVQMPFLIALYVTLVSTAFTELAKQESFLFIHDLARKGMRGPDGYHYDNIGMLIAYGLTTYLSQRMVTTNAQDPMQKQMMVFMPIFITITFISLPLPSGIFLYLVFSNLITIVQYLVMGSQGMLPSPAGGAGAAAGAIALPSHHLPVVAQEEEAEEEIDGNGSGKSQADPEKRKKPRKRKRS